MCTRTRANVDADYSSRGFCFVFFTILHELVESLSCRIDGEKPFYLGTICSLKAADGRGLNLRAHGGGQFRR